MNSRRQPSVGLALAGGASAWGVLLILLAVVLPVYTVDSSHAGLQPRHSLVRVFGYRVLVLAAIPCIISVLVGALLRLRMATGWRWLNTFAWGLAGATLLAAITGFATFFIGIYVLPTGVLLCLAAWMSGLTSG